MVKKAGRDSRTQAQPGPAWVNATGDGVDLLVHVQPGARRSGVVGLHGGRLKVAVAAPAIDGRANAALLALLAVAAGLPARSVTLVAGAGSRDKRVHLANVDPEALRARLAAD
jgi:uncharacterized protein